MWTSIQSQPERARVEVFSRYRIPILRYLRKQGVQEHDAEDLTQEVFLRVCRQSFLEQADREKGKFRSLLLGVTKNLLRQDRDRRSRRRTTPVDPIEFRDGLPVSESDEAFDELWAGNALDQALERLLGEAGPGSPRYYDALVLNKLQGMSYAEVAEKLRVSVTDVTNWVHTARSKVKDYMHEGVRAYCSSSEEFEEELALIRRSLQ